MHNYSLQLKNMFFQTNWMNQGQTKAVSKKLGMGMDCTMTGNRENTQKRNTAHKENQYHL